MSARQTLRDAVLWAGAAAVITALHVAGALWMMRQTASAAADSGPPPSIMIDMAPMPSVTEADETQISSDMVDAIPQEAPDTETAEEPLPDEPPPEPDPVPEEVAEAEVEPPPEEMPEAPQDVAQPEDPVVPPPEELREAEVALPVPVSPRPPERPKKPEQVVEKPTPKRKQPPPSQAAAKARAEAPVADRTAGARDSAAKASPRDLESYKSKLKAHIERRIRSVSGSSGRRVKIYIMIDQSGRIISSKVEASSGSAAVDSNVLAEVRRASPVPPPPPGAPPDYTLPFAFK